MNGLDANISGASQSDLGDILTLLTAVNLPHDGVREHLASFLVMRDAEGRLKGCAGLERHGDVGLALLGNTTATSAALVALILTFSPTGAHFNPAVTLEDASQGAGLARSADLHRGTDRGRPSPGSPRQI